MPVWRTCDVTVNGQLISSWTSYGIPMFKIRRSRDRLIFNMGILILVRWQLHIDPQGVIDLLITTTLVSVFQALGTDGDPVNCVGVTYVTLVTSRKPSLARLIKTHSCNYNNYLTQGSKIKSLKIRVQTPVFLTLANLILCRINLSENEVIIAGYVSAFSTPSQYQFKRWLVISRALSNDL